MPTKTSPASPVIASLVAGLESNRLVSVDIAGTNVDGEDYSFSLFVTDIRVASKGTRIVGHVYPGDADVLDSGRTRRTNGWDSPYRTLEFKTPTADEGNTWTLTEKLAGSSKRPQVTASRPCPHEDGDFIARLGW